MNDMKPRIPLNLQFFAEPDNDPDSAPQVDNPALDPEPQAEPQLSVEEQLAQLTIQLEKERKAREKACSEAADFKKKYNATLDEKQKAALEKAEAEAEREEKFNKLLRENSVNKMAKNFMSLGYSESKATEAAEAQYDGDTETLFKIQYEVQQTLLKEKEAEWLKNRPAVNSGVGDGGSEEDPFLKGFNS